MPTSCLHCGTNNLAKAVSCTSCGKPLSSGTIVMGQARTTLRPKVGIRIVRADGGAELLVSMKTESLVCGQTGEIPLPDDPFIAQTQARFFFSGNRVAVEDVGGGNGTFLRLRNEREMTTGGELRLGRQRLLLEPISSISAAADGVTAWGSPDPGYRFRIVQLLEGGTRGSAFPLKDGDNLVGRELGEIIFPNDGFVSGKHAVLRVVQGRLLVKDLGSSNGTFIRLIAPSFLDDGDQLLIGRQLLSIELAT